MPGQKAPEEHRRHDILRAAYDVAAKSGVEALTVRAVAERAGVSHGTVLFHFNRRDALVLSLLDRVLEATTVLHVAPAVEHLTAPAERFPALLRAEMERLSGDPRPFRLFLEYWALGVRNAVIRRRVSAALDRYRASFRVIGDTIPRQRRARSAADGLAATAVSVIHGCALQAVIDPGAFSVRQHVDAAARLFDGLLS
ncbi:MAG TPA: TetR/AcrR family transcriptional regulator [Gemmatimonadaceae bacterium]|nr:TetR/AcrR family transcriptional regulator [Gemmatimonadaceae bacterium]